MQITEFIEQSNAGKTPAEMFTLLKKASAARGFDRIAYGVLTNHAVYRSKSDEAPWVALNYPDDWLKHYFANRYQEIDPAVVFAPSMRGPFAWDRMEDAVDLTPAQQKMMAESREAGLHDGITVPLHGPFGNVAVVSLASKASNPEGESHAAVLQALAARFHSVYTDIVLGLRPVDQATRLTCRERECLLWSARGKSSWDIGTIIGISEHTVNFHMKNAMAKLDAGSRVVAIVKAIRAGVIVP